MYEDCVKSTEDYYFFCDNEGPWGIVLESLAIIGIVVTIILLLAFLFLMRRVQDCSQWNVLPTQFLFLLGVLGLFSLTFAFITHFNQQTAPVRYFLFGVLFALCFSCLLAHASNLVKLVRGRVSFSWTTILCIAIGVSLLQVIIAIEYVTLMMTRGMMFVHMTPCQLNVDFVVLLVYVLLLMALTFFVSKATFCGPCENWKQHGRLIFVTVLISIIIWVVWISMLLRGNPQFQRQPQWDDPVICIALVTNAWVFLLFYIIPELCILYRSSKQNCPLPGNACPAPAYQCSFRVENQELSRAKPKLLEYRARRDFRDDLVKAFYLTVEDQEVHEVPEGAKTLIHHQQSAFSLEARDSDGAEEDVALTSYGTPIQLQTVDPVQECFIPLPKQSPQQDAEI